MGKNMHFYIYVALFCLHAFTILNNSARNYKFTGSNKSARLHSYRKCFYLQRRRVKRCLQMVGIFFLNCFRSLVVIVDVTTRMSYAM